MENSTKKKSDGILLFARRYTALQKRYASYLYLFIYLKVRRRKMIEKVQLKGGIYEPGSDILELYAIMGEERLAARKNYTHNQYIQIIQ